MKMSIDRLGNCFESWKKSPNGGPLWILLFGSDDEVRDEVSREVRDHLETFSSRGLEIITQEARDLGGRSWAGEDWAQESLFPKGWTLVVVEEVTDHFISFLDEIEKKPPQKILFLLQGASSLKTSSQVVKKGTNSPKAWAIGCYELDEKTIQIKIQEKLKKEGKELEPAAWASLRSQQGLSYGEIMALIQKLVIYGGDEKVLTLSMVDACFGRTAEAQAQKLGEGVLSRLPQEISDHLMVLEGDQLILFLRILGNQVMKLLEIQGAMRKGFSLEEAIQSLKPPLFFKQVPLFKSYIRQWSPSELLKIMDCLGRWEYGFKTALSPIVFRQELLSLVQRDSFKEK